MKHGTAMLVFVIVLFMSGCDTKAEPVDLTVGSRNSETSTIVKEETEISIETTETSEMTSVEKDSFQEKLQIIENNVDKYAKEGMVENKEELLATIQAVFSLNLSSTEQQELMAAIEGLPEEYRVFAEGVNSNN